jgi:hypothetical protein
MNTTTNRSFTFPCPLLKLYFFQIDNNFQFDVFVVTLIVLNIMVAIVSSCSNFVVIYTISKTESLRTPSNLLILGLAISDFGVGVVAQPSYCLMRCSEIMNNLSLFCAVGMVYNLSIWTLAATSLLTLTAIRHCRSIPGCSPSLTIPRACHN